LTLARPPASRTGTERPRSTVRRSGFVRRNARVRRGLGPVRAT
jgi:hypothetical protein